MRAGLGLADCRALGAGPARKRPRVAAHISQYAALFSLLGTTYGGALA
ncbi:tail fiber protein [Cupriavidus basilensis]